jgi:hypothetical protein
LQKCDEVLERRSYKTSAYVHIGFQIQKKEFCKAKIPLRNFRIVASMCRNK